MFRITAIVVVLLIALVAINLQSNEERADFEFIAQGDVFTLDPQRMSWLSDMQVAYCLYEGVVRWNTEDFSIELAGAKSIEVLNNNQKYVFHLKNNGRWSNGALVTAHDYQYAWMRLLTPDTSSDYSSFFFQIKGGKEYWKWRTEKLREGCVLSLEEVDEQFKRQVAVRVIDDFTLEVELVQSVPYFLDQLALAVCSPVYRPSVEGWELQQHEQKQMIESGWHTMVPPKIESRLWISIDSENGRIKQQHFWARPGRLVGNGPFILKSWRYKRDMRLVRNPYYHSPENTTLNSIRATTIVDPNTAVLAFQNGQADWLSSVNVDYQSDMLREREKGLMDTFHAFPAFGVDFFSFNCRRFLSNGNLNPFYDKRVRRAFVYGTDKEAIVKHATRLNEPVVSTIVPPNSIKGYPSIQGLGFDIEKAKKELASAGWIDRNGDGLVEDEEGNLFPIVDLLYTTNTPRYKWVSLELRDQWNKHLGIRTQLRGTDNKFFSADLHAGNFMVARGRWYGDYGDPTTFLDIFLSDNGNNDRGYSNVKIDEAMILAQKEHNPEKRLKMLSDIEFKLFNEELPMLVVCQLLQLHMYDSARVDGITNHPRLVQHLWRINVRK